MLYCVMCFSQDSLRQPQLEITASVTFLVNHGRRLLCHSVLNNTLFPNTPERFPTSLYIRVRGHFSFCSALMNRDGPSPPLRVHGGRGLDLFSHVFPHDPPNRTTDGVYIFIFRRATNEGKDLWKNIRA